MNDFWYRYDQLEENRAHMANFHIGYFRNGLRCVSRLHIGLFFDGLGGEKGGFKTEVQHLPTCRAPLKTLGISKNQVVTH